MKNAGLFSSLFLEKVQNTLDVSDDAQGRLVTLSQNWQRRDAATTDGLWRSFIKAALGNLGFVVNDKPLARGLYGLFEDYSFTGGIALLYVVEPGANLDDKSVGRFWPAKLITALRERKLNWGILTDGAMWRLYSTKSAKPYEDHVELDLGSALDAVGTPDSSQEGAYALFERFFHADSFTPRDRVEYDTDRVAQLKALGLKAKRQKQQEAALSDDEIGQSEDASADSAEREAGIYLCRLDLDGEVSEAILEAQVKEPLLAQVDNVLRYICNGFIADTPRADAAYTEEERREVFESSVKLLYRCLFLFYAEARHLLPSEDRHREIYAPHSINTLCREARKFRWNERTDTAGYDLWQQLKGLVQAVNEGDPTYGVMGYNGGLFDDEEERFLGQHRLRNDFLAHALYWLAFVDPAGTAKNERENEYPIPYEDLEVRHLGEMYESILEFKVRLADTDYLRHRSKNGWQTLPAAGQKMQDGDIRIKAGDIFFGETALERKQSGSYYTPESLVRFLVGKAVIAPLRERWDAGYNHRFLSYREQTHAGYDEAARRGAQRSAQELVSQFVRHEVLPYKVCDPAMGSGHFLVAAANLMADLVVELLAGIEPLPGVTSEHTGAPNHWRRLVTRHCLYGADFNPLAVNLAKLALWLNCFAREHKLTFLDLHLRAGNSLIGLRDFAALRHVPRRRRDTKRDRDEADEAAQELPLGLDDELTARLENAARTVAAILEFAEDDTDRQRDAFTAASGALHEAFAPLADLHTVYLMGANLRPVGYARLLSHFAAGKSADELWPDLREVWGQVQALRSRHRFFHWPLEFPDVCGSGGNYGFSATIGNPPWDVFEPKTQEFYSDYDPLFRSLDKTAAVNRIKELHAEHPNLEALWGEYAAVANEASDYFKQPDNYLCVPEGKLDLYKLFLDRFYCLAREKGFMSIVCPSGFYTDPGCRPHRKHYLYKAAIHCVYSFENRWPEVFTAVDNRFKFVLLCVEKGGRATTVKCAFMQHNPARLPAIEIDAVDVDPKDFEQLAPQTLSFLELQNTTELSMLRKLCRFGHISKATALRYTREINLTTDRRVIKPLSDETAYPLCEGKHINQFDHRFDVPTQGVTRADSHKWRRKGTPFSWDDYRFAVREIAASTNEHTSLAAILPQQSCHSYTLCSLTPPQIHELLPSISAYSGTVFLCAVFNSAVFEFFVRRKITNHLSTPFYEFPAPPDVDASLLMPVVARALRLICTTVEYAKLWAEVFPSIPVAALAAWQIPPAAYGPAHEQALRERLATDAAGFTAVWTSANGLHDRRPDRRDDGDRAQTRAELDALIAHLYGLTKDEFTYTLDTFPVLRRKELAAFGEYRGRRKALEEYERFRA